MCNFTPQIPKLPSPFSPNVFVVGKQNGNFFNELEKKQDENEDEEEGAKGGENKLEENITH